MDKKRFYDQQFEAGNEVIFVPFSSGNPRSVTPVTLKVAFIHDGQAIELEQGYWVDISEESIQLVENGYIALLPTTPEEYIGEGLIYPSQEELDRVIDLYEYWKELKVFLFKDLSPDVSLEDLKQVAKLLRIDLSKTVIIDINPQSQKALAAESID